jgi:hypothetical protein
MKLKHVAFIHPFPHIGETPGLYHFPFECLQKLEPYSSDIELLGFTVRLRVGTLGHAGRSLFQLLLV